MKNLKHKRLCLLSSKPWNQQKKNMASHLITRVRHTACRKEFEEEKLQNHVSIDHGFDTRLQSEYLSSLERRIKALEDKINRQG